MPPEITPAYLASQGLSPTAQQRFLKHVFKTESCWIWTGSKTANGYGRMARGGTHRRPCPAHRVSYILNIGPIPDGLHVLHNCPNGDTPSCVNPSHLKIGTQQDNMDDMWEDGHGVIPDPPKGEASPRAKLTEQDVHAIRSTSLPQRHLAMLYGISQCQVWRIKHGKNWAHLTQQ